MNPELATREIGWNISYIWMMYVLLVPTLAVAGCGLWRRIRLWRCGQEVVRFDRPLERLGMLLRHALLQFRTARQAYPGIFHVLVYTGFIILAIATTVVMLDFDFGTNIMHGPFYLWFQSLIVDLFGGLVLVGIGMAAVRRWAQRPARLVFTAEASWLLILIGAIVVTGFLVEGWRIAGTDDPWAEWSPIGNLVASVSSPAMPQTALETAHAAGWWLHLLLVYGFIAWAPFTKFAHVVTAPLAIFTGNLDGYGRGLKEIDFEADEPLGVHSLERFSWKDLLDLDACTECGRCTAACPANTVGKTLSPRDIILDLRKLMHTRSAGLLATRGVPAEDPEEARIPVIDEDTAVAPEALFACTTCAACLEACPVYIEQLPKILDTRRFLVMEEADYPQTMADAITSLEQRGHPFPGAQFSRVDWAEGLEVPVLSEMENPEEVELLLWVGCANALLERNHKIVRSVATLLAEAGVSFAILGREEGCTGDPARRIGNEFLFEQLVTKNIKLFEKYGITRILTCCPHCYHSFANDYPAFGGNYEVYHHASYLARLVTLGKLRPRPTNGHRIAYHDPCYLGRYNGIYNAPRDLVRRAAGSRPVEMAANRANGFCCGGGGGMSFADEPPDQRVNRERARQALDTGADVVAVACPFCMTMLEDGIGALAGDRDVNVKDVAELLRDAVSPAEKTN
jgi:Fe-S oxidoreductase/nitrate reductase gamma subunit